MIFAPLSVAYSMAAIKLELVASPSSLNICNGMIFACWSIPAEPFKLLAVEASTPATDVPCCVASPLGLVSPDIGLLSLL